MSLESARQLAKRLNCRRLLPNAFPDEICDACVAITTGRHIDVLEFEVTPETDLDELFSIDDAPPVADGWRVYIVTNAAPSEDDREAVRTAAASMHGGYSKLVFAADVPG